MKQVPCYKRVVYQFGPWDGRVEVEFRKLSKDRPAPGFSHQVAINGGNLYWLSEEFRPSVKTARFFYDKYMTGQAAKEHVA